MNDPKTSDGEADHRQALAHARSIERLLSRDPVLMTSHPRARVVEALAQSLIDEIAALDEPRVA